MMSTTTDMADPPPTCYSDPSHNRRISKANANGRLLKPIPSHDSMNKRKLNTRIALLESQLGQAHHELKLLKVQLAKAKVFKKDAQKQLTKTKNDSPISNEKAIKILRAKLAAKEREVNDARQNNTTLAKQVLDHAKTDETRVRLSKLVDEFKASKSTSAELATTLEAANDERRALEAEIKTLRVQTEQWRKAADVAAAVLADDGTFPTVDDGSITEETEDDAFRKHKGSGIRLSDLWKKKTANAKQST